MARQDYAQKRRRGSAATRNAAPRKKAPAKRSRLPLLRLLLTGVALALLVWGLLLLINREPASKPAAPAPTPAQQTAPAPAPTAPPPAPKVEEEAPASVEESVRESRFDFYDILPRTEVQAPQNVYHSTPKDAPEAAQRFLLQAGSFRAEADAERMRAQLLLHGLPNVHTSRVDGENGLWYRVRTGPFNSSSELNQARRQLTGMGISPMAIPLN